MMVAMSKIARIANMARSFVKSVWSQTPLPERTDRPTGMPSAQAFESAIRLAASTADSAQQRFALLVLKIDAFGAAIQAFGHVGGDQIQGEAAARIQAIAEPRLVTRLANDEFVVLLASDPEPAEIRTLATRIIDEIARPLNVDGREAALSCSIGIAVYPQHGQASTLTASARAAMRFARNKGGACHAFVDQQMIRDLNDEVELLADLRLARERGQFELYYQPKIHAPSGEITGAEALLRWNHPTRGIISPASFIPLAERCGLIDGIGRWVIGEACRQARTWRDQRLRMRVAINLSMHQLRQADLAAQIADALQAQRISPELLTCEITESAAMDDVDCTIGVLAQLARMGVRISIDDFGTGHSSLSYLRKLPATELKIDRSFVLDLEINANARKVALAVVNLAKALGLKVVAEGVETEGQRRILQEFGCDQLQGYLFAKPMSSTALYLWAAFDDGPRNMKFRDSLFRESSDTAPMPLVH